MVRFGYVLLRRGVVWISIVRLCIGTVGLGQVRLCLAMVKCCNARCRKVTVGLSLVMSLYCLGIVLSGCVNFLISKGEPKNV